MSSPRTTLLAAALLAAGAVLSGCKPEGAQADPRTAERRVVIARAEPAPAPGGRFTGVVGARVESGIGFRVAGKVIGRLVDAGQAVTKGQPLMRMDPTDFGNAQVTQAGNVAAARARWIQAAADERRNRGLAATGAISQSAYDGVKAAADSAKALLDAAVAQDRVARNQQDYSLLLADEDGTVMETRAEPGQVVAAGQVVVRLAHAGPREAVVNLPETVRPDLGSAAHARLYGSGPEVGARLRQLSDSADPRTRTFEARYVLEGTGAAAPLGATVTVAVGTAPGGGLAVPLGALSDEGHGPGVWVLDPGTSTVGWRAVRVLSLGVEVVEVADGIEAGQAVVAAGGHFLHEGEKVLPVTVQAAMR